MQPCAECDTPFGALDDAIGVSEARDLRGKRGPQIGADREVGIAEPDLPIDPLVAEAREVEVLDLQEMSLVEAPAGIGEQGILALVEVEVILETQA